MTWHYCFSKAAGNAIRHGSCSSLQVSLKADNGSIELIITDNGLGFEPTDFEHGGKNGLGLLNMKELARNMGGTLSIESKPLKGTTVSCRVAAGEYILSDAIKEEQIL